RIDRYLRARGDDPTEVLAGGRNDVVGDGGAEIDHHAGAVDAVVRRHRVGDPVGAYLVRVVIAEGHPGTDGRTDNQHLLVQVARGHGLPLVGELRNGRGDDRRVDVTEAQASER